MTSNNCLDMLNEMKFAAVIAKGFAADPTAIPAHTALRMATYNGAVALGMQRDLGSITPGKLADLTALRVNSLETQPLYSIISHIVYAMNSNW